MAVRLFDLDTGVSLYLSNVVLDRDSVIACDDKGKFYVGTCFSPEEKEYLISVYDSEGFKKNVFMAACPIKVSYPYILATKGNSHYIIDIEDNCKSYQIQLYRVVSNVVSTYFYSVTEFVVLTRDDVLHVLRFKKDAHNISLEEIFQFPGYTKLNPTFDCRPWQHVFSMDSFVVFITSTGFCPEIYISIINYDSKTLHKYKTPLYKGTRFGLFDFIDSTTLRMFTFSSEDCCVFEFDVTPATAVTSTDQKHVIVNPVEVLSYEAFFMNYAHHYMDLVFCNYHFQSHPKIDLLDEAIYPKTHFCSVSSFFYREKDVSNIEALFTSQKVRGFYC
ncbi:MAG: hypothetical protein KatS3mg087_0014 [Patescibacteria group bacterium]|nr:MAG: hypothetical protein KatS3mg087_0014 [Patescibacteria group bacterium]